MRGKERGEEEDVGIKGRYYCWRREGGKVEGIVANISSRASLIAKPNDSPYYIGLDRVFEDSYDSLKNPNGIIQLVLSENRLSQDLIEKWFSQNFNDSILGREGSGANGIATYQPFNGMPELKEIMVLLKIYWGDAREKICEAIDNISLSCLIMVLLKIYWGDAREKICEAIDNISLSCLDDRGDGSNDEYEPNGGSDDDDGDG
ncbi:hypothetical protein TEA_027975 [Camellia sinensis var. sinensis]|uniref:Uncharacterized protein n=1 Tax=Camellia sinensis var. sinensis TaxID=542762 RepID=A0A4S4EUB3_CAMSN|nr:hypothetical protein TEA_027975 [Camellia sinensis var. sinensis]